jgi:hypothetical protein
LVLLLEHLLLLQQQMMEQKPFAFHQSDMSEVSVPSTSFLSTNNLMESAGVWGLKLLLKIQVRDLRVIH